jgi:hypothetical protein
MPGPAGTSPLLPIFYSLQTLNPSALPYRVITGGEAREVGTLSAGEYW